MKTNAIALYWDKALVILLTVIVLLLFRNAPAQESIQQQPLNTGKYQALYVGEDKSGYRIVLIANTETGKLEKRISYDDSNDHQEIFNYATKQIISITRKEEKIH